MFDRVDAHRRGHTRQDIDPLEIGLQMRIIESSLQVAFARPVIGCVKAHKGDKGANVGFGEVRAEQIRALVGQAGF